MKPLIELINLSDPGMPFVKEWLEGGILNYEILEKSKDSEKSLYQTQVTTRSPMGAIVYETGGILIQNGWLRILGSGHTKIPRTLPNWNKDRSKDYLLIADDFSGGFFAINGGAFGSDLGKIYYWPPDSIDWMPTEMNYSNWLCWCVSKNFYDFYSDLRWENYLTDLINAPPDKCMAFYPFLWTKEGSLKNSSRKLVPIQEAFDLKIDIIRQLNT